MQNRTKRVNLIHGLNSNSMATYDKDGKIILSEQDRYNIELSKAMGKKPHCKLDENGKVEYIIHPKSLHSGVPFEPKTDKP
jgi:hypothetical protein